MNLLEKCNLNQPVLIEQETEGPLKKVCFISNQIAAVAIQEEQYMYKTMEKNKLSQLTN